MLRSLKIRTKLMLLIAVPLAALVGAAAIVYPTFQQVKVNGPEYRDIIQAKDLVADILPPPEFIVESYLTVLQINNELVELTNNASADKVAVRARITELQTHLDSLREDYLARNEYWRSTLSFDEIQKPFLEDSYNSAVSFYQVVGSNFLPAVAAFDQATAQRVTTDQLEPIYNQHRASIDETVKLATARSANTEHTVSNLVTDRMTILVGGLFVLVILTIALGSIVRRSISRPVRQLTDAANRVAEHDLPRVVDAIQTMAYDVEIEGLEPVTVDTFDELADLASAFNAMQKTAVNLASEQARIRRNVAEMFVNLGRRNQSLLNRTLSFISELERQEKDPDTLEDLFRLDHLTTRMRRNAESLLVLAGSEPARTWSRPVELGNVVRAALSEIEAYERVDFDELDSALLKGSAVADVAHLIAELVENATTFSPPTERVSVIGRRQADAYMISVIDEGIGMTNAEIDEANRRIDELTRFDLAPSKVLGLYVVGRLAARHGISVRLVESPADGITAKVRLPLALLEIIDETDHDSAEPAPNALAVVGGRSTEHESLVAEVMKAVTTTSSRAPEPPVSNLNTLAPVAPVAPMAPAAPVARTAAEPAARAPFLVESEPPAEAPVARTRPRNGGPAKPNLPSATMKPTVPVAAVEAALDALAVESVTEDLAEDAADVAGPKRLKKRVRGAQLPDSGPAANEDSGRTASADEVRSALSNFQSGITRARATDDAAENVPVATVPEPVPVPVAEEAPEPAVATTASGLKKRVRGAQMPDTGPTVSAADAGRAASADEVRSALSSFQQGVRRAADASSATDGEN